MCEIVLNNCSEIIPVPNVSRSVACTVMNNQVELDPNIPKRTRMVVTLNPPTQIKCPQISILKGLL